METNIKLEKNTLIYQYFLKKNYGQSFSLRSGIINSNYDYIVTLDGDGQNDPSNILDLISYYKNNIPFFLVIGNRKKRNDTFARRIASRGAFFVRRLVLNDDVPDTGCALKLFKKQEFLYLPFFNHLHRFLPFLFLTMGGKVARDLLRCLMNLVGNVTCLELSLFSAAVERIGFGLTPKTLMKYERIRAHKSTTMILCLDG